MMSEEQSKIFQNTDPKIGLAPFLLYFRLDQFIFREGEPSKSMYLIKKGTVGIRKTKGSEFVEIARLYTNEVLGELSFFDRLPRSANAIALTEVEVLEIRFDALDKIYMNVPDYLKTIMASVADRLRKANDTIRRLQKNTIRMRKTSVEESDQSSASAVLAATADMAHTVLGTSKDKSDESSEDEGSEAT